MPTSPVPDPAFEPNSTYAFDEPSTDEEICNMKRNIASINMNGDAGSHAPFNPVHVLTDPMDADQQRFQLDFVSPFMFDQQNVGADSWQDAQTLSPNIHAMSTHSDILSGRSASVVQHFGHITPPDDTAPKSFAAVNQMPATATPHDSTSSNAKSERARNAANRRHAKARKARKESGDRSETPEDHAGHDDKKEKYREKNRLAAAKCRAKKKVNTEDLEQLAREANSRNNLLRAEERHLRDMFSSLRDQALAHDATQGCTCSAIHSYNMHQAQRAVRGAAMVFQAGTVPPSQRSMDVESPSTIASSRAQSFSGMRPAFAKHPRSDSSGGQMGFFPGTMDDVSQTSYGFSSSTGVQGRQAGVATTVDGNDISEYFQQSSENQQMSYDR